jgi:hypothetical protein
MGDVAAPMTSPTSWALNPKVPWRCWSASAWNSVTSRSTSAHERADERRNLRLADGVSVIVLIRTTYTTDGRPVEASRAILAADRHQLSYRLPART